MKQCYFLLACVFLAWGCNQIDQQSERDYTEYFPTNNLDETIKNKLKYLINNKYPVFDIASLKIRQNGNEILQTFEIVDSLKVPNGFTLVFIRYTIGSKSYKDVYRYEEVNGVWGESFDTYFYYSDYNKIDPFGYGSEEKIKDLIKRIDNWRE